MHATRFWRLDADDRPAVDRLAAGLGREPAEVLAYLVLRADREDDPATGLEIRIGTDCNRKAVTAAVERLEDRGLLEATTLSSGSRGRPPKAWRPVGDLDALAERAYDAQAAALLRRAESLHREGDGDGATDADAEGEMEGEEESADGEAELALALNWRPNGLHVPFYAAERGGRYADRGLAVDFGHGEGSRRAVERVVAGEADAALAGAATVVRARAAGEPVCPVAVVYQRAMTVFYTVREAFGEPLERVEQFRDRRIGMPADSETGLLGRLFLSQMDVGDSAEFVATAGEEREALLAGDADIVTGSFADPRELEDRGHAVDAILVTDRFPIYGLVLAARSDALDDPARRSALRRFLAGTVHGWVDAHRDPDAAVEAVAAAGDADRIAWTFERAAEEFGDSEAVRECGWGYQRAETWDRLETALAQGDLLDGATR